MTPVLQSNVVDRQESGPTAAGAVDQSNIAVLQDLNVMSNFNNRAGAGWPLDRNRLQNVAARISLLKFVTRRCPVVGRIDVCVAASNGQIGSRRAGVFCDGIRIDHSANCFMVSHFQDRSVVQQSADVRLNFDVLSPVKKIVINSCDIKCDEVLVGWNSNRCRDSHFTGVRADQVNRQRQRDRLIQRTINSSNAGNNSCVFRNLRLSERQINRCSINSFECN